MKASEKHETVVVAWKVAHEYCYEEGIAWRARIRDVDVVLHDTGTVELEVEPRSPSVELIHPGHLFEIALACEAKAKREGVRCPRVSASLVEVVR